MWATVTDAFTNLMTIGAQFLDTTNTIGLLVVTSIVIPLVFKVIGRAKALAGGGR
jgi:phage-related minor tail protein